MNRTQRGLGEEAQINDLLDQFKDCIMKTCEDANMLKDKFDSNIKTRCKSKLEGYMKNLVHLEKHLAMEKEAANESMSKIDSAFREWTTEHELNNGESDGWNSQSGADGWDATSQPRQADPEMDKIVEDYQYDIFQDTLNKIKETRKSNRKQDPRVKALKNLLNAKPANKPSAPAADDDDEAEEEDEEIFASTEDTIPIDPITKKRITDPVKNVVCGHIYDKHGIVDFLKTPNPRCPYIGCVNRAAIRPTDLVPDEDLKRKIDYLLLREQIDASESEEEE